MECDPVIKDPFPYDSQIIVNTGDPIVDLFELLKSSVKGIAVLNYYKNHRTLNDYYRNVLTDIVVFTEMRTNESLMYFKFIIILTTKLKHRITCFP